MSASEFSIEGQQLSDRRSAVRWIRWHLTRYKLLLVASVGGMITQNVLGSVIPILVGAAFTAVLEEPPDGGRLTQIALVVLVVVLLRGLDRSRRQPGQRNHRPAIQPRRARRDLRQPARQEPDLPQPAAGRRSDGPHSQRRPPARHDGQSGNRVDHRFVHRVDRADPDHCVARAEAAAAAADLHRALLLLTARTT